MYRNDFMSLNEYKDNNFKMKKYFIKAIATEWALYVEGQQDILSIWWALSTLLFGDPSELSKLTEVDLPPTSNILVGKLSERWVELLLAGKCNVIFVDL